MSTKTFNALFTMEGDLCVYVVKELPGLRVEAADYDQAQDKLKAAVAPFVETGTLVKIKEWVNPEDRKKHGN